MFDIIYLYCNYILQLYYNNFNAYIRLSIPIVFPLVLMAIFIVINLVTDVVLLLFLMGVIQDLFES